MVMALKAAWGVKAGLIPGEPMPEYTRSWSYTSQHYDADGNQRGEIYHAMQKQAADYALQCQSGGLNWSTLEYFWM